jgi:hypothetical protein
LAIHTAEGKRRKEVSEMGGVLGTENDAGRKVLFKKK